MQTFRNKSIKVVDKIYCDMCGVCCTSEQLGSEYATLEAQWGYNSSKDETQYHIQICENCFDDVIDFMKKKRRRMLGCFKYPYEYDPLKGK